MVSSAGFVAVCLLQGCCCRSATVTLPGARVVESCLFCLSVCTYVGGVSKQAAGFEWSHLPHLSPLLFPALSVFICSERLHSPHHSVSTSVSISVIAWLCLKCTWRRGGCWQLVASHNTAPLHTVFFMLCCTRLLPLHNSCSTPRVYGDAMVAFLAFCTGQHEAASLFDSHVTAG